MVLIVRYFVMILPRLFLIIPQLFPHHYPHHLLILPRLQAFIINNSKNSCKRNPRSNLTSNNQTSRKTMLMSRIAKIMMIPMNLNKRIYWVRSWLWQEISLARGLIKPIILNSRIRLILGMITVTIKIREAQKRLISSRKYGFSTCPKIRLQNPLPALRNTVKSTLSWWKSLGIWRN